MILLGDRHNNVNILDFTSFKSKRVGRSIFGGEALAMVTGFDHAIVLKDCLSQLLTAHRVLLAMLVDSKALFDSVALSLIHI